MGAGGWVLPGRWCRADALPLRRRARAMVFPLRDEPARRRTPSAHPASSRATTVLRAGDGRARRLALGLDPLELRRRNHVDVDQASGLPYSSKQLLACYDRAAELAGWDERERAARAAARRAPARHGLRDADLVGRRRPARRTRPSGSTPTGTRASSPASRTSAPGRSRRRGWSPPRSSGCRSSASSCVGGDTAPNLYGPVAGGSMTTPSVMPAVRCAAGKVRQDPARARRRRARDRARRPRRSRGGRIRSRDGALDVAVDRGDGEARRRDDRRLGLARPEPRRVRASTRSAARSRRSRSTPARARCAWSASSPSTTSAASSTRSAAASQVEGGVLQGIALRALRGARRRPDDRRAGERPRSTTTRCRRSPTCRRSWSTSSTCPTRTCRTSARRGSASRRSSRPPPRSRTRSRHATGRRCRRAADDARARVLEALRVSAYARPGDARRGARAARRAGAAPLGGGTDLAGPDRPRRSATPALLVDLQATGLGERSRRRRRRSADRRDGDARRPRRVDAASRRTPPSRQPRRSRPRRSSATSAPSAATSASTRAAGTTAGVEWHCWLGGGDTCYAQIGDHRKHNLEPGDCISAHPSDLAPALAACGATVVVRSRDGGARAAAARALPPPTEDDRSLLTLAPGELVTAVRLPAPPDASAYERAGERRRSLPARLGRGRAPRRRGPARRRRRRQHPAGARPEPIRSRACRAIRRAAWKRDLLAALVERAVARVR